MRPGSALRNVLVPAGALLFLGICGIAGIRLIFSRTREFRAQAQAGQPIVGAIEQFRKQTGSYPPSLAALTPSYLPTVPDLPGDSQQKFNGWDYQTVTNGVMISYTLRYYMGRGGVEYEPPN
jgi:hypothetical protein